MVSLKDAPRKLKLFIGSCALLTGISLGQFTFASSASLRWNPTLGAFTVACEMEQKPGRCIFDSGARISMISETSLTRNLRIVGHLTLHGAEGDVVVPLVTVPQMKVGKLFHIPEAVVARTNDYYGLPKYLGVIGGNALVGQSLVFDFSKGSPVRVHNLTTKDTCLLKNSGRLYPPASGPIGKIEFEVSIDGIKVHAMWDTHATSMFSESFIAAHQKLFRQVGTESVADVLGHTKSSPIYKLLEPVCFGEKCVDIRVPVIGVKDEVLQCSNGQADMIVGVDLMDRNIWAFDYAKGVYGLATKDCPLAPKTVTTNGN